MSKKIDPSCHIGETHGIYTIIDVLNDKDKYGHWIYKCQCVECGFIKYSHYGAISGEKSKATECHHLRADGSYIVKHRWENKRLGRIFGNMMNRCYNKNDKSYRWYGEKGIEVCFEWLNSPGLFERWAIENGYGDTMTIDRKDASKNYCPENCQWILMEDNSRKAGNVTWITVGDETLTGRQWAQKLCIGINAINRYVRTYGIDKTKELIIAILKEPLLTKCNAPGKSLFSIYGIQV